MIKKFKLYENEDVTKDIDSERIPEKKEKEIVKKEIDKPAQQEEKKEVVKESITSFNDFLNEGDGGGSTGSGDGGGSAYATLGTSYGMGNVIAPQPSSTPGDVAGSQKGSGDLPAYDNGKYFGKKPVKQKKTSKKKRHEGTDSTKEQMYITSFSDWINNGM